MSTSPLAPPTAVARPGRAPAPWRRQRARKGAAFTLPFYLGFAFTFLLPIVWALGQSLLAERRSGLGFGRPEVSFVGWDNYARALADGGFWAGMGRVALFGLVMVPLGALLSLAMALLVDQVAQRASRFFRIAFLVPYVIPNIVATLIWIYLYSPQVGPLTPFFAGFGLDVSFFSGELVWVAMGNLILWNGIGFTMLILYGSLKAIPPELFDAARIDGASEWQVVRHVKIPYVRSTLVLTTMLSVIGALQIFNEPLLFQSVTPETITNDFTPVQAIYHQAFSAGDPYYAAALSVVLAMVVTLASVAFHRLANREPIS